MCSLDPRDTRRYDISLNGFMDVAHYNIDVTVVNPLCATRLQSASYAPCEAAKDAERSKDAKYKKYEFASERFCPFAMEAHGGMGPKAASLLKYMSHLAGDQAPENTIKTSPTFIQYSTQTISVALKKAVTSNVMDSIACTKRAHSSGYIKGTQLFDEDDESDEDERTVMATDDGADIDDLLADAGDPGGSLHPPSRR
jgi:hypothetical protein